jgi:hypothetical protein
MFQGAAVVRVEVERLVVVYQSLVVVAEFTEGIPHEIIGVVIPGTPCHHAGGVSEYALPVSLLECRARRRIVRVRRQRPWWLLTTQDSIRD